MQNHDSEKNGPTWTERPHQATAEKFNRAMNPVIEELRQRLYVRAEAIGEPYWDEANKRRRGDFRNSPRYALYVERTAAGVTIYWKRVRIVKAKGQWKPRSTYIAIGGSPKNRNTRYAITKFKAAPEWERLLIEQVEEKFAEIRRAARYLGRMTALSRSYPGCKPPTPPEEPKDRLEENEHEEGTWDLS